MGWVLLKMGWVLLKRRDPRHDDLILVPEHMYTDIGDMHYWEVLLRGSDADYEVLEEMAKLTDNFIELGVNREKRRQLYYEKRGEEHNIC